MRKVVAQAAPHMEWATLRRWARIALVPSRSGDASLHVVAGEARVVRQIEIVAELRAKGLPTAQAVPVLEAVEVSLDAMRTLSLRGAGRRLCGGIPEPIAEHDCYRLSIG
jgi:hypothetical protein